MRWLVLLFAFAMPVVAWLTNAGTFGPDNGTVSDRYPTLLIAAGYAFAIWGLIFLLDLAHGVWQATGTRKTDPTVTHIAPFAAAGFACTALWMPMFAMGQYIVCLLLIFAAFAALLRCAMILTHDATPQEGQWLWAWAPLSLHAGWLALAAFLNLAQVIVAYQWLPIDDMRAWSFGLFGIAAVVLLYFNHRMHGNIEFAVAAIWALLAVYVKQSSWGLTGAREAAWIALAIAVVLAVQTMWLRIKRPGGLLPTAARAPASD